MKLWSWRWTMALGWHWALERGVTQETAQAWRDVYAKDEPGVSFTLASSTPRKQG